MTPDSARARPSAGPAAAAAPGRRPKLLHRPLVAGLLSTLAAGYLGLVSRTGRWRVDFDPATVAMLARGETGIGVFWHQRLLGVPALWQRVRLATGRPRLRAVAVVSRHGDGELIARTLDRLGVGLVRGSSKRAGARAAREAIRVLEGGDCLAVVVDGPRGPHGHVHLGALFLAKVTGRPIVPLTYAADRGFQAGSWDRLLVPAPFARGGFHLGPPLFVPPDADAGELERLRLEVGRRLEQLNRTADAALGVTRR